MARGILTASTLALAAATANGLTATRSTEDGGNSFTFTLDNQTAGNPYIALPECNSYTNVTCEDVTTPDNLTGDSVLSAKTTIKACQVDGSYVVHQNTRTIQVAWFDEDGNTGTVEAPGCEAVAPIACDYVDGNYERTIEGLDVECIDQKVVWSVSPDGCSGYSKVEWTAKTPGLSIEGDKTSSEKVVTNASFNYSDFGISQLAKVHEIDLCLWDENDVQKCFTHTYTVDDTTPPVIHEDESSDEISVNCDDVPIPQTFTVTDNCAATYEISPDDEGVWTPSGTETSNTGKRVYTYTAVDTRGRSTVVTKTVNVVDSTPPTLKDVPDITSAECGEVPEACIVTAFDNCSTSLGVVPVDETTAPGETLCEYKVIRTWDTTDEDGKETTASRTISVVDNTEPVLVGKPNSSTQQVSCDVDVTTVLPEIHAVDKCDGQISITPVPSTIDATTVEYTYVAEDKCEKKTSYVHTIVTYDNQKPVISGISLADEELTVEKQSGVNPLDLFCTPVVHDNCDDSIVIKPDDEDPSCNSTGCECVYVRHWDAEDANGNAADRRSQTITVVDMTPPSFGGTDTPTDPLKVECDSVPEYNVLCEDVGTGLNGQLSWDAATDGPTNDVTTYTCEDACGNIASKSVTVTSEDTTPPQFLNIAADFDVDCSQLLGADGAVFSTNDDLLKLIPAPEVVENCGEATTNPVPVLTYDKSKDCRNDLCTLAVTFTATDANDLEDSVTITATVKDTTPPTWDTPLLDQATSISCDKIDLEMAKSMTATDDCASTASLVTKEEPVGDTPNPSPNDCDANYVRVRTWTTIDPSGNSDTYTRTVTVRDTTPPYFTSALPGPRTENTCKDTTGERDSIELATYQLDIAGITFEDDCSALNSLTVEQSALGTTGKYTKSDTSHTNKICNGDLKRDNMIRVTDECGHYVEHSWTVTTIDSTSPNFTTPDLVDATYRSEETNKGQCGNPIQADDVQVDEDCSLKDLNFFETSVGQLSECHYRLERRWNPEDDCGNKSNTRDVVYTVIDNTPPTLVSPVDETRNCDCHDTTCIEFGLGEDFTGRNETWSDCCDTFEGNSYFEEVFPEGSDERVCNGNYTFLEIHTYTDAASNSATKITTVTVIDNAPPSFVSGSVPLGKSLECLASYDQFLSTPGVTDRCTDTADLYEDEFEKSGSSKFHGEKSIYVYTARDDCNNSVTEEVEFSYSDTTPPVMKAEDDTVECSTLNPPDLKNIDTLVHSCTDACTTGMSQQLDIKHIVGPPQHSTDPEQDGFVTKYVFTYTCTDVADLTHSDTATLTVIDTTPPYFVDTDENYKAHLTYECDSIETPDLPYGDDCSSNENITYTPVSENTQTIPGDSPFEYELVKTFIIEDESGHVTSFVQTVTIQDTKGPNLTVDATDNLYQCEYVDFESTEGTVSADDACSADDAITILLTEVSQNYVCDHNMEWVRTWTAIDEAGNQSSETQTVRILNEVKPTFDSTPESDTKEWTFWQSYELPQYTGKSACGASLNADEVTPSNKQLQNDCPTAYTNTRTIEIKDTCQLSTQHTWTETAIDTVPPYLEFEIDGVITSKLGGDTYNYTDTKECVEEIYNFDTFNPVAKSDDNQHVHYSTSLSVVPSPRESSTDRTVLQEKHEQWVISDCANNSNTYVRREIINDTTPPYFTFETTSGDAIPQPESKNYDCTHEVPNESVGVVAIYNDDCSAKTVTGVPSLDTNRLKDRYEDSWSYTAADECGNSISFSYTITVSDQTEPDYYWGDDGLLDAPVDTTAHSHDVPPFVKCQWGDNCVVPVGQKSDCDHVPETISQDTSSDYVVRHCYTMPDQNTQNPGQHCYNVTVSDTTAPTLVGLPDAYVTVDEHTAWPAPVPDVSCTDFMAPMGLTVVYVEEEVWHHDNPHIRQFNMTRTWECTDISGNTAVFTQTLAVLDKVMSEFNCVPDGTSVICNDETTQEKIDSVTALLSNSTENCDWTPINVDKTISSKIITRPEADDKCEDNYKLVYTYTVYDVVDNNKTQTQTVSVIDNTPPVFDETKLAAIVDGVQTEPFDWCHYTGAKELTAVDACENREVTVMRIPTVTYPVLFATEGLKGTTVHPDDGGFNYDIKYTFETEDRCGNEASYSYTDKVRDLTPPTFECDDSREGENFCNLTKTIECNGSTPPAGPDGYTADNGSYGTCAAMDETTDYVKIETFPDNTPSAASPSTSYAGCLDKPHNYKYTVRATDASGKYVEQDHVYSYTDTTPPSLSVVEGKDTMLSEILPPTFDPVASTWASFVEDYRTTVYECNDDCGTCEVTMTFDEDKTTNTSVDVPLKHTAKWIVTWKAKDQCGLVTTTTKTLVKAVDTTPPEFEYASAVNYEAEMHKDDKCGGVYKRCLGLTGKKYCNADLGLCTADEAYKGTSDFDTIETLPLNDAGFANTQQVSVDSANGALVVDPEQTDNCKTVYTKKWIAEDNVGNKATYIQTITITDTIKPVFNTTPGPWSYNCQEEAEINAVKNLELTAYDVATSEQVKVTRGPPSQTLNNCSENHYQYEYTYVAKDKCGLEQTHKTTLTVQDTEKPEITWTFDHEYNSECVPEDPQDATDFINNVNFEFKDNCGNFDPNDNSRWSYVQVPKAGSYTDEHDYTVIRTWTFYDTDKASDCANDFVITKEFVVSDETAPRCHVNHSTLECDEELPQPDASTLVCNDTCVQDFDTNSKSITPSYITQNRNEKDGENYEIIYTWEVVDLSGNTDSYMQTFTFLDRTPPIIAVPDSLTDSEDSLLYGQHSAIPPIAPEGSDINTTRFECKANMDTVKQMLELWVDTNVSDNCAANDYLKSSPDRSAVDNDITDSESCSDEQHIEYDFSYTDKNGKATVQKYYLIAEDKKDPVWVDFDDTFVVNRVVNQYSIYATQTSANQAIATSDLAHQIIITTTPTLDDCASNALDYVGVFSYNESTTSCHIATTNEHDVTSASGASVYTVSKTAANGDEEELNYTTYLVPGPSNATDNCKTDVQVTPEAIEKCEVDCTCENRIKWKYVASDNCGGSITRYEVKTASDRAKPKLVGLPAQLEFTDEECSSIDDMTWINTQLTITATDNSDVSVTAVPSKSEREYQCGSDDSTNGTFTVEYTWRAEDICGNLETATRTYTHEDKTPHTITKVQDDYNVECSAELDYVKFKAKDPCGGEVDVGSESNEVYKNIHYEQDVSPLGTTVQSLRHIQELKNETEFTLFNYYYHDDDCSNPESFIQTITVQDTTKPQWTTSTLPGHTTVQCTEDDDFAYPQATDTCMYIGTVDRTTEPTNDFPAKVHGETRVHTYWVEDKAKNRITYEQTVTILDNTPPYFKDFPLTARDKTNECHAISPHPVPGYEDGCSGNVSYDSNETIPTQDRKDQGLCLHNYYETTDYEITDKSGNVETATYSVYIKDTTPPSFQVSPVSETTVDISLVASTWPENEVTVQDLCDPSVTVEFDEEIVGTPECAHKFTLKRTWTATDCANNVSSEVSTIVVTDSQKPNIVPTAENGIITTVDSMEWGSVVTIYDVVDSYAFDITDNSESDVTTGLDPVITNNNSNIEGKSGCAMELVYPFFATDQCDNKQTFPLTVNVVDNTPPEFNDYPENVTIEIDEVYPACTLHVVNDCEEITVVPDHSEKDGNNLIYTWYAIDSSNNSQSHRQTIFVKDTTPPHLTHLPQPATQECDCTAQMNTWPTLFAVDNDPANSNPTVIHSDFTEALTGSSYKITHTWSAADAAFNAVSHDQVIEVLDTTPPKIVNLEKDGGIIPLKIDHSCSSFVPDLNLGAKDLCDSEVTVVPQPISGGPDGECMNYEYVRTYTAEDKNALVTTFAQTVNILDTEEPVCVGCNEEMCLYPNGKSLTLPLDDFFGDRVTDNCSGINIINVDCRNDGNAGSCSYDAATKKVTMQGAEGGEYVITGTAVDGCNLTKNIARVVSVFPENVALTKKCLEPTD